MAVGGSVQDYNINSEIVTLYDMARHYDAYNFQLGETMDIVNFELYSKRCQEAFDKLEEESEDGTEDDYSGSTMREEFKIQQRIKKELIKEGEYTTYVVEGILDFGDRLLPVQSIYMNRDAYFALTGFTENQISGVQYKIDTDKAPVSFYQSLIMWDMSGYAESMIGLQSIKKSYPVCPCRSYIYIFVKLRQYHKYHGGQPSFAAKRVCTVKSHRNVEKTVDKDGDVRRCYDDADIKCDWLCAWNRADICGLQLYQSADSGQKER